VRIDQAADWTLEVDGERPIALDLTSHELLAELAKWDWGWTAPVNLPADAAEEDADTRGATRRL